MHGIGLCTWTDGRSYFGQYEDDKKHGFGIYRWPDGRCYFGQWCCGKQHGLGIYQNIKEGKKSSQYGLWEDGKRSEWLQKEIIDQINSG